jgi:hypothetical protein
VVPQPALDEDAEQEAGEQPRPRRQIETNADRAVQGKGGRDRRRIASALSGIETLDRCSVPA